MTVLKKRYRPVTFRMQWDEYELLMKACESAGARSLSDFARMAVLQKVQAIQSPQASLTGDLSTLSERLLDLDRSLEDTQRKLRSVLGFAGKDHET
jgi:uncharacterized protein (DUF1778 family)